MSAWVCMPEHYGLLAAFAVRRNCVVGKYLDLAHNHPSGVPEPSRADEALTRALRSALALIDVCLVDHIIVAGDQSVSFAERGLL